MTEWRVEESSRALALFDVAAPPALVLARGLSCAANEPSIAPTRTRSASLRADVLRDRDRLTTAVKAAHEVLARGDAAEISGYLRRRAVSTLLQALGRLGGAVYNRSDFRRERV